MSRARCTVTCPPDGCVLQGVVHEVDEQLGQARLVPAHGTREERVRLQGDPALLREGGQRGERVGHEVGEIDRFPHEDTLPPVGTCQGQQLAEELRHPRRVVVDAGQYRPVLDRGTRAGEGHLRPAGEERERRPQLVGRIGGETALARERLLQTVQHRVEGRGEPPDLVRAGGEREPLGQIGRPDPPGGARDPIDRPERAAREE